MPPTVARLYRFPVKGMTAEPAERVRVLKAGAVEGDRVLGFLRTGVVDSPDRPSALGGWWRKQHFTALMVAPGVARLAARFDPDTRRLAIALDGAELAAGDVAAPDDRARLAAAVTRYVAALGEPRLEPEDAYTLVGDGATPRFHDRGPGHVTLVGSASVAALAGALGAPVDERRFRMNVTLEGLAPWEELDWIGRRVRIGALDVDVTGPVVRCLATHANPESGERDLDVMQTLTRAFGHEQPTMGVLAVPRAAGEIAIGDAVTVSNKLR